MCSEQAVSAVVLVDKANKVQTSILEESAEEAGGLGAHCDRLRSLGGLLSLFPLAEAQRGFVTKAASQLWARHAKF